MFLNRKISFTAGIICGLSFAPIYFIPGIFMLSILCAQISAEEQTLDHMLHSLPSTGGWHDGPSSLVFDASGPVAIATALMGHQ